MSIVNFEIKPVSEYEYYVVSDMTETSIEKNPCEYCPNKERSFCHCTLPAINTIRY
jgi:hypothetical protein